MKGKDTHMNGIVAILAHDMACESGKEWMFKLGEKMKVTTKQKVIEERVPEYEPGDIVCACGVGAGIDHEWAIIVEGSGGVYKAIPLRQPKFDNGETVKWNFWHLTRNEIDTAKGVVSVPVKGIEDVKVAKVEEN